MAITGGSITLHGVTDEQMAIIFEIKSKHPQFGFNPGGIQQVQTQTQQGATVQIYNNVLFNWSGDMVKVVLDLLQRLS